jgi:hypothetical protein
MDFLPQAFQALSSVSQFVIYKLVPSKTREGKTDKFPVDHRTGAVANAHDPAIWLSADAAIATAKRMGAGYFVGFVFTANDPFFFLDIDNCLEPCGTKWSALAISLLGMFAGAAVEVSSSGRGLHIIGSGIAPAHGCKNTPQNLEFYTSQRFVALTGLHAQGDAGFDCTNVLPRLIEMYFPIITTENGTGGAFDWTTEPCAQWNGNTDDAELIARAIRSNSPRAVFGNSASFKDLWEANAEVLAKVYPDAERSIGYNESSADGALAQHLAFWTGNNCERIRRLMLQSALKREKWEREDYLPRTIMGVCSRQSEFLNDKPPQPLQNAQTADGRGTLVQGSTYLALPQQLDLFAGCVYVSDDHKVLVPGGYMLNAERFKVMYGGYTFNMDGTNERTSRNAFEAFTENQGIRHPQAHGSCFRPDRKPAEIIEKDGQRLVNVYYPVVTPQLKGDVQLFINHLEKHFPNQDDRMIFLSYLAGLVQYPGHKFQWCPLIQGVEGNGKTFYTRVIAFAIGMRYSHFPKASELGSKFNDWQYTKIFIGVEDIYFPDSRAEIMETLKPMITGTHIEIEPKGGAKVTREICCNYIINTNHKDGLRKTNRDRRFAPFYTPQQEAEDLRRDGMDGAYFRALYQWALNGGFAAINYYLRTFEIPAEYGLDACLMHRAPHTTSTGQAISESMGRVEIEIMEAVNEGMPGFRNGWVSSMALDKFLTLRNLSGRAPIRKRPEIMLALGYIKHPGLNDGRVNNPIPPDGGKPRLYIKADHVDANLRGGTEIAKAYIEAQK